jgi:hypothetical protein
MREMAAQKTNEVRWFPTLDDAKRAADAKNAAPAEPGKDGKEGEKRGVFKVYEVEVKKNDGIKLFAIGQTPSATVGSIADKLGVHCTRTDYAPKVPLDVLLASLSPEEVEQAQAILKQRRQEAAKKLPAA